MSSRILEAKILKEAKILNLVSLAGKAGDKKIRQEALYDLIILANHDIDDYKNTLKHLESNRDKNDYSNDYSRQLSKYFDAEVYCAFMVEDVEFVLSKYFNFNYPQLPYNKSVYFGIGYLEKSVKTDLFGFFPESVTMQHRIEYYTLAL
jgi:hypothetical protein